VTGNNLVLHKAVTLAKSWLMIKHHRFIKQEFQTTTWHYLAHNLTKYKHKQSLHDNLLLEIRLAYKKHPL